MIENEHSDKLARKKYLIGVAFFLFIGVVTVVGLAFLAYYMMINPNPSPWLHQGVIG